jgi:hypothetical protein
MHGRFACALLLPLGIMLAASAQAEELGCSSAGHRSMPHPTLPRACGILPGRSRAAGAGHAGFGFGGSMMRLRLR